MKKLNKALAILLSVALLLTASPGYSAPANAEEASTIDINVDQDDLLDVVLSLGQTDSDVSELEADLLAALISKGVPEDKINIQAVESSEVSAGNTTSGWETYDHTNYTSNQIAYYRPYYAETNGNYTLYNHIVPTVDGSSTDIDFYGYGAPAYKDFMYMPNDQTGKKTFDFTIQEGEFYDALDGAGFLFNTSFSSSSNLASRTMSGYLIFFTYPYSSPPPTVNVYKFTNVDVNAFHNNTGTAIASYSGFQKIASFPAGSTSTRVVKIEATSNTLKMWYNGSLVNWTLVPSGTGTEVTLPTDFGSYGFGPIVGYLSHACNRHTHFTFYDVSMATESSKKFSEVIREPEWRDQSKRFVINAQDTAVSDFSDPVALGEILTRLGNENISYIGWGKSAADGQAFIDKNNGNGLYVDKNAGSTDTYGEQIAAMADYIYAKYIDGVVNDTEYLIYGKPSALSITPESEKTNTADTDWPNGKWRIDQDEDYYDNATGVVPYDNIYLNNLDISFTETGKYDIYYQDELVKTVYVHRKPVAGFGIGLDSGMNVSILDQAFDPDFESQPDKGIASTEWSYKETSASTWTAGMPTVFAADKEYIVRQIVTDGYGVSSDPYLRYVSTASGGEASVPVAEFKVIPGKLLTYITETVTYEDTSYDPKGETVVQKLWTVSLNGTQIYSGAVPKTSFSGAAAGTYKIALSVKNESGIWSEEVARYLTVVRDSTAPEAVCNLTTGSYTTTKTATVTLTDEVGGSGFSHRYAVVTGSATVPTEWGSMGTNNTFNMLLNDIGTKYIHVKAVDYAGNEETYVFGPFTLSDVTDPSAPDIDSDPGYTPDTWVNTALTVTATGSTDDFTDDEDLAYEVSTDGIGYSDGNQIQISGDGSHTVYFRVTDESGNDTVASKTYLIDGTKPTCGLEMTSGGDTYPGDAWTSDAVTAELTGGDSGGSGLDSCEYKIDDGDWTTGVSVIFDESGTYTLSYRSTDNAGNISDVGTATIKVDVTDPLDFAIDATVLGIDRIRVQAETTDEHSGADSYRVHNGTSWSEWMDALDETLDGFDRGESVTVKVEARDIVGNVRQVETTLSTKENNEPVAVDDQIMMEEDAEKAVLPILDNDTDPDLNSGPGETIAVTAVSSLSDASAGVLEFAEGIVTFTPAKDFFGEITFEYTLEDSEGAQEKATVTIKVTPVNDPPMVLADQAATGYLQAVLIDVMANDTDVEKDTLSIASLTQPAHGTAMVQDGQILYTPSRWFAGEDSFTCTVTDGMLQVTKTVEVTVAKPVLEANADTFVMKEDAGKTTLDLLGNDEDGDGGLVSSQSLDIIAISKLSDPSAGTVALQNGAVAFTPAADYFGKVSFTYTVENHFGQVAQTTVILDIEAVNDAPTLVDDAAKTMYATPVTIDVLANDSDKETLKLAIAGVSTPGNGSAAISGGKLVYTPDDGFAGTEVFAYTVKDGEHSLSASVTVEVSFPEGTNEDTDVFKPGEEQPGGSGGGTDPVITDPPEGGTIEVVGDNVFFTPEEGTDGVVTYRFTLEKDGEIKEYEALVYVDPETGKADTLGYGLPLSDDEFSLFQDESLDIDLSEYLESVAGLTGATISTQPMNGTISYENGTLIYTPDEGFVGADGAIVTLQFGDESFAYCVTFDVVEKSHGGFFSWWCLLGWLAAAAALAAIYKKNKHYFAAGKARTAVYVAASVVLLALLCLLRQYYGYLPSILLLALYLGGWYLFTARRTETE